MPRYIFYSFVFVFACLSLTNLVFFIDYHDSLQTQRQQAMASARLNQQILGGVRVMSDEREFQPGPIETGGAFINDFDEVEESSQANGVEVASGAIVRESSSVTEIFIESDSDGDSNYGFDSDNEFESRAFADGFDEGMAEEEGEYGYEGLPDEAYYDEYSYQQADFSDYGYDDESYGDTEYVDPYEEANSALNEELEADAEVADANEVFEQCEYAWSMDRSMPNQTLSVINRFIPAGVEVHCAFQQRMADEESEADVVLLVYGSKKGCPGNCTANNLCAIVDDQGSYLYSVSWHESEYPPSLYRVCSNMDYEPDGSTLMHCEEQPPGFYHPIVFSKDFKRYNEQFRFCFRTLL